MLFLNNVFNIMIVFGIISFVSKFLFENQFGNHLTNINVNISALTCLVSGILLIKRTPYALLFFISYSGLFMGVIIFNLRELGFLPHNFWTFHAIGIGSMLESILFSLSLAYRMNLQERERVINADKMRIGEAKFDSLKKTIQMISHDIRRPFSIFESVIAVLETKKLTAETEEHLVEVKKSLSTVNSTVSDILDTLSHRELEISETDIKYEIHQCLKMVIASFHSNHNIIFIPSFNHRYKSSADRKKLSRILTNIITNACEAMKLEGTLWFCTKEVSEHGGKFTHVTIGNSGSFIAESDIIQIFDLFYTKNKPNGTGLGLSISKKYVEELGGRIWCTSSQEIGVEFHFLLPSVEIPLNQCHAPFPTKSCQVKLVNEGLSDKSLCKSSIAWNTSFIPEKIIILDDSRPILAAWAAKLKDVPVSTFQSPELFFDARLLDPDLTSGRVVVISDYHFDTLSEMKGVEFALKIAPLPVILCSSFDVDLEEFKEVENIVGVIPKRPLNLEELILSIREITQTQKRTITK